MIRMRKPAEQIKINLQKFSVGSRQIFIKKGILIENMTFVSILSCPVGLKLLTESFPDLRIITAQIDKELND